MPKTWSKYLSTDALDLAKSCARRAMEERKKGIEVYPPQDKIFRALTLTPPEKTKVVLIGQDPYHEPGQANGLCFSVEDGTPLPPSLKNIYKELVNDIECSYPSSGDLTPWAEQGVLMLNTALTVERGKPNSHANWGWDRFVVEVFKVCRSLPQPIVFLLWGGQARGIANGLSLRDAYNKVSLCSSHPSPLGASKGNSVVPAFLGSRPFSNTNHLLMHMDAEPIDWVL